MRHVNGRRCDPISVQYEIQNHPLLVECMVLALSSHTFRHGAIVIGRCRVSFGIVEGSLAETDVCWNTE